MVGIPSYWRTLGRDTIHHPELLEVITTADIVNPWSVGRFGSSNDAAKRVEALLKPDLTWCRNHRLGYLPVAFPGFSWHNFQKSRGRNERPGAIPRRAGRFFWDHAVAVRHAGIKSLYVAMFDELDEGTAVLKIAGDPPVGESPFVSETGLKPYHYLRLAGEIGRMLRGERATVFPKD